MCPWDKVWCLASHALRLALTGSHPAETGERPHSSRTHRSSGGEACIFTLVVHTDPFREGRATALWL